MSLKYARIHIFQALLAPFSRFTRGRRFRKFLHEMNLKSGEHLIDLGGTARYWHEFPIDLNVIVLNLPCSLELDSCPSENIRPVAGDATDLSEFQSNSFDVAFSNSVIEHVGNEDKRRRFAAEVRRVGTRYWVQTPSIWFPIEAHTGMPFWWFYPLWLRERIKKRWRTKLPAWTEMVDGTTVLTLDELHALFPDAKIWTERFLFIPKSYVAYGPVEPER